MTTTSLVRVRKAQVRDLPFIMQTERLPGYDWFVGRWDEMRHREAMADVNNAYLIGEDEAGASIGFAILRQLDDPDLNIYLQRVAVAAPGRGLGRDFLRRITDWAFAETSAFRFWLLMKDGNARADHVYRSLGFIEEGRLRQTQIAPDGTRLDALVFSLLRPEWPIPASSATT